MRVDPAPPVHVQPFRPAARIERAAAPSPGRAAERTNAAETAKTRTVDAEATPEERRRIEELKRRDREVRAHEQAHQAAGGVHAGAPRYEVEAGPDGERYATGGEVSIDVEPVPGDPAATIRKMQTVREAALAPLNPSTQDRQVAAKASAAEAAAKRDLAEERTDAASPPRRVLTVAQRAYATSDPVLAPGVLFDAVG